RFPRFQGLRVTIYTACRNGTRASYESTPPSLRAAPGRRLRDVPAAGVGAAVPFASLREPGDAVAGEAPAGGAGLPPVGRDAAGGDGRVPGLHGLGARGDPLARPRGPHSHGRSGRPPP